MAWSSWMEHASLKLFSLGVALLLFIFVSVENTTPRDVDFNLNYIIADDMMILSNPPKLLKVTLQGPWATLRSFDSYNLEPVHINLSRAEPGAMRHVIDVAEISPPAGMKVLAIQPKELEITLDRRVERQVPIHVDIAAPPAYGFEVTQTKVVPNQARIIGPVSKLHDIESIHTQAIDLTEKHSDVAMEVELRAPLLPIKLIDKQVQVHLEINEEYQQRSFNNVNIRILHGPKGATLSSHSFNLTLKGPKRLLENIDKTSFEAVIDVPENIEDHSFEATVQLQPDLPQSIQVLSSLPKVLVQWPPVKHNKKKF